MVGGSAHITASASRFDPTDGHGRASQGSPARIAVNTAVHAKTSGLQVGTGRLLDFPLRIGASGTQMGGFTVLKAPHLFTVHDHAWTPGAITLTGLTSRGMPLPDVAARGSFRAPLGVDVPGMITLVAPTRIDINGPIFTGSCVSLTRLQLHFSGEPGFPRPVCVPEPGTLLLFGAGSGAFALYASKRRSSA